MSSSILSPEELEAVTGHKRPRLKPPVILPSGTRTPEAKAKAAATRAANNAKRKSETPPEVFEERKERRRALVLHHANKRRAEKLRRTPSWADMDEIKAIYARAQGITEQTGIPHHVDHIIPLRGKNVSGLHVATNLQILPASENSRKRNKFEVEA